MFKRQMLFQPADFGASPPDAPNYTPSRQSVNAFFQDPHWLTLASQKDH